MRRNEVEAVREQKGHLVSVSLPVHRYNETGKVWSRPDTERRDYLISSIDKLNNETFPSLSSAFASSKLVRLGERFDSPQAHRLGARRAARGRRGPAWWVTYPNDVPK